MEIGSAEKFDMVVTFKQVESDNEEDELKGIEEIEHALEDTTADIYIKESECLDVVLVELSTDCVEAARKLSKCPTKIISKVIPVQVVVSSDEKSILFQMRELALKKITPGNSYVTVSEFRNENLDYKKIEKSITDMLHKLNMHYDENKPDYIIYIECIGKDTGLGIYKPDEII